MKRTVLLLCALLSLNVYAQQTYYKTQLHCHSTNSDGNMAPQTVAQEYLSRGYEIIFLTDHNYMTNATEYQMPGILAINSEEYTFAKHINGFFLNHTVDASGFEAQQAIDSIRAQGGMIQFNHPVIAATNDWSYNYSQFMALHDGPDFIEIHNAGTDMIPFAKFNMQIWDSLLMSSRKIWGTATDDMHKLTEGLVIPTIDIGWVMIRANSLNPDSIRAALTRGDFYGTNGVEISYYAVDGNIINISSANATKIKFIGDKGVILSEVSGSSASYTRTTESYVRIELEKEGLLGAGDKYAFTQPVFFDNTSNITENNKEFQHNITSYPNPATSVVNICFNTEKESNVKINIYDLTGKLIINIEKVISNTGFNEMKLDISRLNSGMYFYSVNINGLITTKKFTKI